MNFTPSNTLIKYTDYIVVGGGIAGIYAAIDLSRHGDVLVLSKGTLPGGSSMLAQGGIAAAVGEGDSPALHLNDSLRAGAGMCDEIAVDILTNEGPRHIQYLIDWGVPFDTKGDDLALTTEGAHSRPRVLHAGGDTTGKLICEILSKRLLSCAAVTIMEETMAVDLLTSGDRCLGILALDKQGSKLMIMARAVILATGGVGQLYEKTTNPLEATGDGIAMALRTGVTVKHLEFVQFHPTMLDQVHASGFLISEAVRGEGAILRNELGEAFMRRYHEAAELAPRDVVARAIFNEQQGSGRVYLDARAFQKGFFAQRFPSIYRTCLDVGIDPAHDQIPVTPAAHYHMGGLHTDTQGRTSLPGLYACGEIACTGVHGANRLASNSLLETLVFGYRAAQAAHLDYPQSTDMTEHISSLYSFAQRQPENTSIVACDKHLRETMQRHVGIVRNKRGLHTALESLGCLAPFLRIDYGTREEMELQNKIQVALAITQSALCRANSCGAHFRED